MGLDLGALNEYLADKTFIEGCVPPQRLAASPASLFGSVLLSGFGSRAAHVGEPLKLGASSAFSSSSGRRPRPQFCVGRSAAVFYGVVGRRVAASADLIKC